MCSAKMLSLFLSICEHIAKYDSVISHYSKYMRALVCVHIVFHKAVICIYIRIYSINDDH